MKRSDFTRWKQGYITPPPHTSFCKTQWRHSVKTRLYKNPPPYFIVLASKVKTKEVEVIKFHSICECIYQIQLYKHVQFVNVGVFMVHVDNHVSNVRFKWMRHVKESEGKYYCVLYVNAWVSHTRSARTGVDLSAGPWQVIPEEGQSMWSITGTYITIWFFQVNFRKDDKNKDNTDNKTGSS